MIFAVVLALLADLASALLAHPPLSCSYKETVGVNNMVLFTNPNWPGPYGPGEICRWLFACQEGYVCHLQCKDVGLPQSKGCFMDKLMVSRSGGDPMFRDAKKYCGRRRINIRSFGSTISIGLVTSHRTPGGRFRCLVKTELKRNGTSLRCM